jgi:hypothetical protein
MEHEATRDTRLDRTLRGLRPRQACASYGRQFLQTLYLMRSVRPEDTLHGAAWFRDSLRNRSARLSGRIDPVLEPVPHNAVTALRASVTELTHDHFVAEVNQAVASAARQAKRPYLAPVPGAAQSIGAVQVASKPRLARAALWRGAALAALALGVAGWMLAEPPAMVASPASIAQALLPNPRDQGARAPAPDNGSSVTSKGTAQAADSELVAMAAQPTPERFAATPRADADKPTPNSPPTAKVAGSPREECGARTQFALYRCMQLECAQPRWAGHAQCVRLQLRDEVE